VFRVNLITCLDWLICNNVPIYYTTIDIDAKTLSPAPEKREK
jgi:hypothetical protein